MSLTLAQATALTAAAFEEAARLGLAVSACVVDLGGAEIATQRMDAAPPFTAGIARSKASSAAAMRRDTEQIAELKERVPEVLDLVAGQVGFTFTSLKGGIILRVGDTAIGAMGVSGASSDEDVQLARHAVASVLG